MSAVSIEGITKLIAGFEAAAKGTTDALPVLIDLPTNDPVFFLVKDILEPVLPGIIQSLVELLDIVIALLEKIRIQLQELQKLHRSGFLFVQFHGKLLNCLVETGNAMQNFGYAFESAFSIPGLNELSGGVRSLHTLTFDFFKATDTTALNEQVPILKGQLSEVRIEISNLIKHE